MASSISSEPFKSKESGFSSGVKGGLLAPPEKKQMNRANSAPEAYDCYDK